MGGESWKAYVDRAILLRVNRRRLSRVPRFPVLASASLPISFASSMPSSWAWALKRTKCSVRAMDTRGWSAATVCFVSSSAKSEYDVGTYHGRSLLSLECTMHVVPR